MTIDVPAFFPAAFAGLPSDKTVAMQRQQREIRGNDFIARSAQDVSVGKEEPAGKT